MSTTTSVKLRQINSKALDSGVLEILNHNLWVIEHALQSVGAATPVPPIASASLPLSVLNRDSQGIGTWQNLPAIVSTSVLLDSSVHTDTATGTVVRGDLIVGNSTPAWARKAKGTALQVLAMDSGANDPGWASLDNTYLADRTRTVWIPDVNWIQANGTALVHAIDGATWPAQISAYQFIDAPAAGPQGLTYTWKVPADYKSGTTITFKVLWASRANSGFVDVKWVPRVHYLRMIPGTTLYDAAATTLTNAGLLADQANIPLKQVQYDVVASGVTITSLAAGDHVRLGFDRLTTDANDTYDKDIQFFGLAIEYTADM